MKHLVCDAVKTCDSGFDEDPEVCRGKFEFYFLTSQVPLIQIYVMAAPL